MYHFLRIIKKIYSNHPFAKCDDIFLDLYNIICTRNCYTIVSFMIIFIKKKHRTNTPTLKVKKVLLLHI